MKSARIVSAAVATAIALAACAAPVPPTAVPPPPTAVPAPATAVPAPATAVPAPATAVPATKAPDPTKAPRVAGSSPGAEYDAAMRGELKGKKVIVDGAFTGEDAVRYLASMKEFIDKSGIAIDYIGTKEFEKSISIAVDAGKAPDIADFPQPGLMARFVSQGKVIDLNKTMDMDFLKKNYGKSWLDMATMPNKDGAPIMAGVWQRVNGKSLVWYPKPAFDKLNYKVPTTWAELIALQDQIKKDGDTPWCIGIESGAATGWAFTDWVEEMMLRTTTPENYDKWVSNQLKFNSPEVKRAVDEVAKIWFDDKNVLGGRKNIPVVSFGDAPKPMFDKPAPKCWLHKQGNFITSFFPKDVKEDQYDFFYLPGLEPAQGSPVLVAGDIMAQFNDRPEVRAVMQAMATAANLKTWLKQGGAISPHNDATADMYGSKVEAKIGSIIQKASTVRFDASDLMPGEVGAGSFWKLGTDFVTGKADFAAFADGVDKSWPKGATQAAGTGGDKAPGWSIVMPKNLRTDLKGKKLKVVLGADGPGVPFEEAYVKKFSEATGIEVTRISGAQSATERLAQYLQQLGAGSSDVDAYMIDVIWPGIVAEHAVDLGPAYKDTLGNYFKAIADNNTVGGKLVGVPWFTDAGLLYYRKDLLAKYGFSAAPKTWAELEQMAAKIQEGERASNKDFWGFVWQGAAYEGLTCDALEWQVSNGGGGIIEPDGKVSINNDSAIKSFERAKSWIGKISPEGVTTYKEEESRNVWQGGNAAFMRNWPYAYSLGQGSDSKIKDKFDVVPLPKGDGDKARNADTLGGWQLMVSKYSKNQDAAIEFVKFATSPEMQKAQAIERSLLPTIASVYDDADVLKANPYYASLKPVFQGGAYPRPSTVSAAEYNNVSVAYFTGVNEILTGKKDAKTAVGEIEKKITAIMKNK